MSKQGTPRTTIMNRRAGQQARLTYWLKRLGLGVVVIGASIAGYSYLSSSGYIDQTTGRMARSFNEQMGDVGFRIENVKIEGRVNSHLQTLRHITDIEKGQPIFEPDLTEIKDKIEKVTWVKNAVVERHLPDTIFIRLEERRPIALWQNKGKLSVIDSEGQIVQDNDLGRFKNLVILVGEKAPEEAYDLVALLEAEPELKQRIESAKWVGDRRWDLYLKNGVSVRMPEHDIGHAIKRLADAQGEASLMDRKIESIDLRDPLRIIVQTSPGAVEDYQASYQPQKNI